MSKDKDVGYRHIIHGFWFPKVAHEIEKLINPTECKGVLDLSKALYQDGEQTWFYRNCRQNRKSGAKICGECPFRAGIEDFENDKDMKL